MNPNMLTFYYLLLVYKFSPEIRFDDDEYLIRLHHPFRNYWTEFSFTEAKCRWIAGVEPFRIFKRNRGIPKI